MRDSLRGGEATVSVLDGSSLRGRITTTSADALLVDARSVSCTEIDSALPVRCSRRALWAVVVARRGGRN